MATPTLFVVAFTLGLSWWVDRLRPAIPNYRRLWEVITVVFLVYAVLVLAFLAEWFMAAMVHLLLFLLAYKLYSWRRPGGRPRRDRGRSPRQPRGCVRRKSSADRRPYGGRWHVVEGQEVKAGDLIAELHDLNPSFMDPDFADKLGSVQAATIDAQRFTIEAARERTRQAAERLTAREFLFTR